MTRHHHYPLFVYGSLMNARSRESTLGHSVRARRATLDAAAQYHLRWCFRSRRLSMTSLGIYQDAQCHAVPVPGMVLWVTAADLRKLDEREEGYTRVTLARQHVILEDVLGAWPPGNEDQGVLTYAVAAPAKPCPEFPITARYLSLCAERVESD